MVLRQGVVEVIVVEETGVVIEETVAVAAVETTEEVVAVAIVVIVVTEVAGVGAVVEEVTVARLRTSRLMNREDLLIRDLRKTMFKVPKGVSI